MALSDHYAFVALTGVGLMVIDVTDPASPRGVGIAEIGCSGEVAVADNAAYVACGDSLAVLDVAAPNHPVLRYRMLLPQGVDLLAAVRGKLFTVAGGGRYDPVGSKLNVIDPDQCN